MEEPDCIFYLLPPEISIKILSFISNLNDIKNIMLSCKLLNEYSDENQIWKNICREKWKDKQNYSLNEKKEKNLANYLKENNDLNWKKLFKRSLDECKRNMLTVEDLTTKHKWSFSFKHNRDVHFNATFYGDSTLIIDRLMGEGFIWKIIDLQNGRNAVQVNFFPYLQASRSKDYGWSMQNAYVIFHTTANDEWSSDCHPCTIVHPECLFNSSSEPKETMPPFYNYFFHYLNQNPNLDNEDDVDGEDSDEDYNNNEGYEDDRQFDDSDDEM